MKTTLLRTAVAVLGLGLCGAAHAASAIAHDDKGRYGYQMNGFTQSQAIQQAVGFCAQRSRDCTRIFSTDKEGFSAIFAGEAGIGHALAETTPERAQRKAREMCAERTTGCRLELAWRERPGRPGPSPSPLPPTPHTYPHEPVAVPRPGADARATPAISAVKAVELANERAPSGVEGRFALEVKATEAKDAVTYLSSELDYRDQRNLSIIIEQPAIKDLEALLGAPPADALRGRHIEVTGRAERRKILFMKAGVPSGLYYYQTGLKVTDASQIKVID